VGRVAYSSTLDPLPGVANPLMSSMDDEMVNLPHSSSFISFHFTFGMRCGALKGEAEEKGKMKVMKEFY